MSVSIGAISAGNVLRNQGGIWSGPRALLGFNEDNCFKAPWSEIIKGPKPGVGSEPISGMLSRSSSVNTLENWLFKISDFKTTITYNFTVDFKVCYPWIFLFKPFYVGPKTFWVVLDCLTKVALDILFPCRLKILAHAFPGGKKNFSSDVQILLSLPILHYTQLYYTIPSYTTLSIAILYYASIKLRYTSQYYAIRGSEMGRRRGEGVFTSLQMDLAVIGILRITDFV